MRTSLILVCTCFVLASCGNSSKVNNIANNGDSITVTDMHNAENALDYQGEYKGVLPAADCPGIETTLTLNSDNTFTLHSQYLERDATFDEKGTYSVDGNVLTLKTEDNRPSYYKIEENRLRMLDADKKEVTGELAEYYILNKVQ